jgi:hypothetical protein
MTFRHLALALALGGLAQPLWAAQAGHGGGGSSGGHGGGGSSGGHGGGGSSGGHGGGGSSGGHSGGGSSSGSSSRARPPSPGTPQSGTASSGSSGTTLAERRHPRPGTGTGGFYRSYPYYRYLYNPYFYSSFYYGWYDPFYDDGYYGAPGDGYSGGDRASIRVLVNPDKTRVFVDGYYAGIADDFDGLFERLHVSPGRHEITLKLEGYRTHRMKVYVAAKSTLKIHYDMVKGSGEDPAEDLAGEAGGDGERYNDRDRPGERDRGVSGEERPNRLDTGAVPVISNMTAVFTANAACIRAADALMGSALVITFNYADSGADVSGGRVQFSRSYNTGRSESHVFNVPGGTPMSGQIQVLNLCPRYNDATSSTETISLFDASGNASNSLSVTVDRPTGAP